MCSACCWGKPLLMMHNCRCYAGQLSDAHADALASCSSGAHCTTSHCSQLRTALRPLPEHSRHALLSLERHAEQGIWHCAGTAACPLRQTRAAGCKSPTKLPAAFCRPCSHGGLSSEPRWALCWPLHCSKLCGSRNNDTFDQFGATNPTARLPPAEPQPNKPL